MIVSSLSFLPSVRIHLVLSRSHVIRSDLNLCSCSSILLIKLFSLMIEYITQHPRTEWSNRIVIISFIFYLGVPFTLESLCFMVPNLFFFVYVNREGCMTCHFGSIVANLGFSPLQSFLKKGLQYERRGV